MERMIISDFSAEKECLPSHKLGYFGVMATYFATCLRALEFCNVKKPDSLRKPAMLRLNNIEDVRCRLLHSVIVVIAVCALTVSVATRYCYAGSSSAYATTILHKHSSPQTARQRLSKDAATWIPPIFFPAILRAATFYPRVAPAGPPVLGLFFEKSLYNRPPPSSASLI
jgi:hypothetical protein